VLHGPASGRQLYVGGRATRQVHAGWLARARRRARQQRRRRSGPHGRHRSLPARRGRPVTDGRKPPALLLKTLKVTFGLVTRLLLIVCAAAFYTVRLQIRDSVIQSLDTTQGLFVALENRRQVDLQRQAATLAESSTLKAALDTYIAEAASSDHAGRQQLLTTIRRELEKVAARVESDAIVAVDVRQATLAAAGPFAGSWPIGSTASLAPATVATEDAVARVGDNTFRILPVPLLIDDER